MTQSSSRNDSNRAATITYVLAGENCQAHSSVAGVELPWGREGTAGQGQCTKSLCDRGSLSACVLTRLEIVDSGAWRPVLRIEVFSTSSKTGVAHEYGFRQPAASAHDRGHERAQALCGHAAGPYPRLQAVRGVSQAIP